ncbi:MAG: hypothetical protein U1E63_14710 [Burkholderiales bacterium]
MHSMLRVLCATLAVAVASPVFAGDFDGSKRLICAPVQAMDCALGEDCLKALPEEVGAPAFMRIDFEKKTVSGPQRTSPMQFLEKSEKQLLLQGTELGYAWTIALDQVSGKMMVTLVDRDGAFVLFGSCTPL